jgi:NDP-sugar pyrophosphorylase family protein
MRVLWEETPRGTIGAAREAIGDEHCLLVINVDNLTSLPLQRFVDFHRAQKAALTIASHQEPFRIPFGELVLSGNQVEQYLEKPVKPVWISSGTYVIGREACSFIGSDTRTDIPELVASLLGAGKHVAAFRHSAAWIDINDADAVRHADEQFSRMTS